MGKETVVDVKGQVACFYCSRRSKRPEGKKYTGTVQYMVGNSDISNTGNRSFIKALIS